MDDTKIALELLVRNGEPKAVELFADSHDLDKGLKKEKVTESFVYYLIHQMEEQSEGGIHGEAIAQSLLNSNMTEYFNEVDNMDVLQSLVDVLYKGTQAMMEAYAQIGCFDVLSVEYVSHALRRNMARGDLQEKMKQLIGEGYRLVFCPYDIDGEMVEKYFAILEPWQHMINSEEVVVSALEGFVDGDVLDEMECNDGLNYKKAFLYPALDKLIELTDKRTVSKMLYDRLLYGESEEHNVSINKVAWLVDAGKILSYKEANGQEYKEQTPEQKSIAKFENAHLPSRYDVNLLKENIGMKHASSLPNHMGKWVEDGKLQHVVALGTHASDLYDQIEARSCVTDALVRVIQANEFKKAEGLFDLPKHLLDEKNPALQKVIEAYKTVQESRT